MSGELVQQQGARVESRPAASELEQWGRDLGTAYHAARQLVTTSFVPQSYKGKPEEAAAAILTGQEIGLAPLAALRSIDIINGTPAMRAVALRALVQSVGHEIWVEESTATRAVVKGRRKGSDRVQESVWTIERARELQLTNKENWKKQPIAMLLARATSELVRLIASDVILGIPYSVEEVIDLGPEVPAVGAEAEPRKPTSTVKRRALPKERAEAVEPPLPEEAAPVVAEPGPVEAPEPEPVLERDESAVAEEARRAFESEPELDWGPER